MKVKEPVKREAEPAVEEPKIPFTLFLFNAYRYYHRIGNLIFSPNTYSSRVVKSLNTFSQLSICIAIVTSCYSTSKVQGYRNAIFLTILLMRFCQPLFNLFES